MEVEAQSQTKQNHYFVAEKTRARSRERVFAVGSRVFIAAIANATK